MKDFERTSLTYKEKEELFNNLFTTGYLPNIRDKFALIDLLGWLVFELKKKKPGVTYYQITYKLAEGTGLNDEEIEKWAILAEDFSNNVTEFEQFNLKIKDVPKTIRELFKRILSF